MIVSAFTLPDHSCSMTSWGTSGVNDLGVAFVCFDAAGTPFDGRFQVLIVE